VHAAGIVHRDIKPENVYLVKRGRDDDFVKLVDFGIARVLVGEGIGPTTTQAGRVFGTATYISPEAATGEEADQRSDIYSLGVLTYQLFTGELPFEGKTAGAVLMQHVHQAPPPLGTKGQGAAVPVDLARVVMRALSKDPNARQQTLAEFLDSLAEAADHAGLLSDARAFLFSTIWGDELAAPGSYLAELLGSSGPPTPPSPLADTQPMLLERDPEVEALLSSAPKPFGTTAHDLAAVPGPKRRRLGWFWASLGLLATILVAVVAGTWWSQRGPRTIAEAPQTQPADAPPVAQADAPELAEVVTDATVVEPPAEEAVVPDEPVLEEEKVARHAPKVKRKRTKRAVVAPVPVPGVAPASVPVPETDDGIDWTVPDLPEEPSAPTGTPDTPARNPIVIDEPPSQ
jgi:Protein kinase domain